MAGGGPKDRNGRIECVRATRVESLFEAIEKPFGGHMSAPAFRVRDKFFVMCSEDASTINPKAAEGCSRCWCSQ